MSITLNLNGTSVESFRIGKRGTGTVAAGSLDLNTTTPNPKQIGRLRFDDSIQQLVFCLPSNVEIALGGGSKYVQPFNNSTDWGSASAGYYTITILATAHSRGTDPIIQVLEQDGDNYDVVAVDRVRVNAGDVSIRVPATPDGRFAGKVVIM